MKKILQSIENKHRDVNSISIKIYNITNYVLDRTWIDDRLRYISLDF